MRIVIAVLMLACISVQTSTGQSHYLRLIESDSEEDLVRVKPNDNRLGAGVEEDGVLQVDLDVMWSDWRIEKEDHSGLRVAAIAERGEVPMIPAPMIRVETGTLIRVSVRNTLSESSITVLGLQSRPSQNPDSLVVQPNATEIVEFDAGEPGTYFYRILLDVEAIRRPGERTQLAGAFIVDPVGGSVPDRVMVMNIFSTRIDSSQYGRPWVEALTINGLSWPFTERVRPTVGDTLRWRVINASGRNHPMHLHGFFYDVMSIGKMLEDDIYAREDRRKVVTEFMLRRTTMTMEWVPTRPGNWLFHCHLSFHVSPEVRLPNLLGSDERHQKSHMAGLVTGIEVQPGPTDLIERGEPRYLELHANEAPGDSIHEYRFTLQTNDGELTASSSVPGPVMVLRQYQPTFVSVKNNMSIPTGVHWHGLELDSWADGVPGWSASDGKVSPVIQPGEEFTYKLSLMRPGTFIYHSHLDDVHQLTGGLYGALIVLGEDETYRPDSEYIAIVGWNDPDASSQDDWDFNGQAEQPTRQAVVGQAYRIRVINIAPAGNVTTRMLKSELPVPLLYVAKDGAEFSDHQKVDIEISPRMGVGETADFVFAPTEVGTYELLIGPGRFKWKQVWEVVARD